MAERSQGDAAAVAQEGEIPLQWKWGPGDLCFSLDQGFARALQADGCGRAGVCMGKRLLTLTLTLL